ncbi:hypothetical protein PIGBHMHK_00645 [Mycoplasmopsis arginini]|nr:hypothetical protein [Mycoplasmopsis arginini]
MKHYPNHLWAVSVKGGIIVIKAMNISSNHGVVIKMNDVMHDVKVRSREVMRAGGELLERARLVRGAYNGDKALTLEGAPKYSPLGLRWPEITLKSRLMPIPHRPAMSILITGTSGKIRSVCFRASTRVVQNITQRRINIDLRYFALKVVAWCVNTKRLLLLRSSLM